MAQNALAGSGGALAALMLAPSFLPQAVLYTLSASRAHGESTTVVHHLRPRQQ